MVLGAGAAEAADFTFTVPVNARNLLPEVTRVGVTCKVYRGQSITVAGGDSPVVTPQNGTVQQTLTVEINVPAGQGTVTSDLQSGSISN